jgi:molybdopterin molybdotransferase
MDCQLTPRAGRGKAFALAGVEAVVSVRRMISLDEARAVIAQNVQPLDAVRVPLAEARGRVLREDIVAPEDIPDFDRSAMDGYAVALDDRSVRFRIVAEIQPGAIGDVRIGAGECARIFTGAAIPAGASQVIMQEDTQRDGDTMIPTRRTLQAHIRMRGEDAKRGARLLPAGVRFGPAEVALLAQIGSTQPLVSPPVCVLHIATGNELVDPESSPAPGKIRDSNSALIAALLAERGAIVARQTRSGDSLEALAGAIESMDADAWDLLLISGGASVGDFDFGTRALGRLGFEMRFDKINLRPGKPLVFATRGRQVAFVIPGNPVSQLVTFHLAIARALECFEGFVGDWPLVTAELGSEVPEDRRETWWPARLTPDSAEPLAWQSSGDLVGIAGVNALIRIASGTGSLATGTKVACLRLGG